jgi:hypothetical protein
MATQEFYIRNATENEARGPFNHEQLVSLAENSQIDPTSLYYDAAAEQWAEFTSNAELMAQIFPEKKKLRLGTKEIKSLNVQAESAPPISVNDMLAAAEGLTSETKGRQSLAIDQGRAAKIGLWSALFTLLGSAAALAAPSVDKLLALDFAGLITQQPLALLGVLDLFLALMLGLGSINFYPFVRFRAIFGLGMVGFILFVHGQTVPLVELMAGSAGLYFCTICISYAGVGLAALAGLGGMAGFAWFVLNHQA